MNITTWKYTGASREKLPLFLIVYLTSLLVCELYNFDDRCMNVDTEFWWIDK